MTNDQVLWTATDIMTAISCRATCGAEDWIAHGVSIDTRTLEAGDVFFAISGPNFDALEFVAQAFEKGAVAAVVTGDPGTATSGAPLLIVKDVTVALQELAVAARSRLQGKVVAVTGSVGKTGTKEMLRLALGALGRTAVNVGNLNNHLGLPLSLCRIPADTEYTVVEMGMNHPEEIRPLAKIARPHVAVITAIEPVHMEFFPSVSAIADAKAEIFDGVETGGVAVINHANAYFDHLATAARRAGIETVVGFGQDDEATVQLVNVVMTATDSTVAAIVDGEAIHFRIGAPGLHIVTNSLAVLGVVKALGGDLQRAADTLEAFAPMKGRGQLVSLHLAGGPALLIDESYNASPASMRAAMAVAGRSNLGQNGRRIAVLGDMLELGDTASDEHRSLVEPLQEHSFNLVFTAGQYTQRLWDVLPEDMRGGHSISPDKLAMVVSNGVHGGDVIMVKGSLGSRIGVVVEALRALEQPLSNEGSHVPCNAANGN